MTLIPGVHLSERLRVRTADVIVSRSDCLTRRVFRKEAMTDGDFGHYSI